MRLIPLDIGFVPEADAERAAVSAAEALGFPDGICTTHKEVTFIDGGQNFPQRLPCQHCGYDLLGEYPSEWTALVTSAYGATPPFADLRFSCPRCDGALSLYDLSLREPSHGFARWVLECPATGHLVRAADMATLSSVIGSQLRAIYAHI